MGIDTKFDLSIYRELKDHIDEIKLLGVLLDYEIEMYDVKADPMYTLREDDTYDESIMEVAYRFSNKTNQYKIRLIYCENKILKYFVNGIDKTRRLKSLFVYRSKLSLPIVEKIELTEEDFRDLYLGLQKLKEHL